MNDHNLDDLIIGDPEPGGGKSKSLLSLIALLLIILIVGVFLAKLLFSGPEELEKTPETELSGIVKPHTPAAGTPHAAAKPVEKIPEELQPMRDEKLPANEELTPLAPTHPAKPAARPKPEKRAAVISTRPKPKPQAKKPVAKPKPKPAQLFEKKPKSKSAAGKKVYYIQVGSFKRMPDKKFLDKMKAVGYEPIIVKTGSMIKVRVGPYSSYGDAKAKLPEVKSKLGIAGFVVRKK